MEERRPTGRPTGLVMGQEDSAFYSSIKNNYPSRVKGLLSLIKSNILDWNGLETTHISDWHCSCVDVGSVSCVISRLAHKALCTMGRIQRQWRETGRFWFVFYSSIKRIITVVWKPHCHWPSWNRIFFYPHVWTVFFQNWLVNDFTANSLIDLFPLIQKNLFFVKLTQYIYSF